MLLRKYFVLLLTKSSVNMRLRPLNKLLCSGEYVVMNKYIFMFISVLTSGMLEAETCVTPSLEKKIQAADYIFIGQVVLREKDTSEEAYKNDHERCGSKYATLKVFNSWKGGLKNEVKVYSWDACDSLGTYFDIKEHYLVYAKTSGKGEPYINDIGACHSELLIEALANNSIAKLDKKFKIQSVFSNSELYGAWESYDNQNDKPFKNVNKLKISFNEKFKFTASTYSKNDINRYIGIFYAKDGVISILDQDGPDFYYYEIVNSELVISSFDGETKYFLKKT